MNRVIYARSVHGEREIEARGPAQRTERGLLRT